MGASCRRRAEAATAATASGAGAMSPRPAPEIREAWLLAAQEEDAEAAGWCARLCEDLQGAEAFAASDGLDAFISVAMGQSVKGSGGLMVALAEALTMEMSEFKVAIFETLCAAAQWPSLKGRIAGCGVLGVITAKLLSPRPHPPSKALMARLCGMLATDSLEVRQLGDTRRATEFARLREQLIASGAVKALVAMLSAGAIEAASAAGAIEKLAEAASEEISAAGSSCGSTGDSMTAETKEREHPNESCHGTFDKTMQELISSSAVPAMLKRLVAPDNNNDAEDELVALEAIASSLSKLVTLEGCTELIAPITEPTTVEDLCKVLGVASRGHHDLGGFSEQRKMVQHLLRCLHHLGTKHDCWPEFSKDLAEDLYGLLLFRCAAAAPFLQAILLKLPTSDSAAFLCYFERKRLHQALQELMNNSIDVGSSAAVIKILDSFQQCHRCGVIGSFPACGNCKLVASLLLQRVPTI